MCLTTLGGSGSSSAGSSWFLLVLVSLSLRHRLGSAGEPSMVESSPDTVCVPLFVGEAVNHLFA